MQESGPREAELLLVEDVQRNGQRVPESRSVLLIAFNQEASGSRFESGRQLIEVAANQRFVRVCSRGIKIKRNAFERRLDRDRIPHEKIGGRRVIAKEVLGELITKELAIMGKGPKL